MNNRFEEKYFPIPEIGCWVWSAGSNEKGYGVFWNGRRLVKAHRHSWEITNGSIPESLNVLHRCGNRWCVNPEHLYVGTQKDNAQDTKRMGRLKLPMLSGEQCSFAKLDYKSVEHIRSMKGSPKGTGTLLAKQYGVSKSTIYAIWSGDNWKN